MKVLIPAYEPTKKMLVLIQQIQNETNYQILIIDDGSGEKYQEIFHQAQEFGCIVLKHFCNKGKGEALKTGFAYLLSQKENDAVVCADCDGQHHIEDIIKVANAIEQNKNQIVLGTRRFKGKVPFKSRFGNTITAWTFALFTGKKIADTQTGLRGYPCSMLKWLCSVEGSRFEYEFNLLMSAIDFKYEIKQIPILTIYDNNNRGTHFRPVVDSARIYWILLKFCTASSISAVLDFSLLFTFKTLTESLLFGVVVARIVSSVLNYYLNKKMVFKVKDISLTQSAPKYFGLVLVIMIANYLLLSLLVQEAHIPVIAAKILTELILFNVSYIIQKRFIFKKEKFI
ncbi:MAG: glycosyl transferase family 2 [Oscillospiraceae bacterium]|nr:glycosyl transferase family 2 [Oscillospiraceae bacterium]